RCHKKPVFPRYRERRDPAVAPGEVEPPKYAARIKRAGLGDDTIQEPPNDFQLAFRVHLDPLIKFGPIKVDGNSRELHGAGAFHSAARERELKTPVEQADRHGDAKHDKCDQSDQRDHASWGVSKGVHTLMDMRSPPGRITLQP